MHDLDGFLDATALGDDIFNYEDFFAPLDFKASAQDEFTFLFFSKNKAHT